MVKIFLTGSTGFIGSHLCKRLTEMGHEVVALIRDVHVSRQWLGEALRDCKVVFGDVRNFRLMKRVLNQYEIEWCFHMAAHAIVKTAYRDPITCFESNIMGTVNILEACRELGIPKTLVMNTDKIFGNQPQAEENAVLVATEPYGTSKVCQDYIARCFMETYDMRIISPRSCNAYGYDLSNRIVPNTIRACLRGESPVIFKGETTRRQYIYIKDLVDALIRLMEGEIGGVYNIATPDILSQDEVVRIILQFFSDLEPKMVAREERPKEIRSQSMICSDFGWQPKYSFEDGIKETIEEFRKWGW